MDVKLYDEVGGAKAHFFTFFTPPSLPIGEVHRGHGRFLDVLHPEGVKKKKAAAFYGAMGSHRKHFSERGGPQSGTVRQFRGSV